ncbi:MAG: pyridoxal-phosphate dependent enzyme [Deltaproteobacteria bacterium]|nr:pyridoxal-phosphate dependent enzyme [Deltaproteobacteria bacterium]
MTKLLFERYPSLIGRLPIIEFVHAPTPVRAHPALGQAIGHEALYVKHDGLSAPEYGGNKPRKLEFLLADARRTGAAAVVTMGGIGTNHGLATAIFARKLGLACHLVLFDQPMTGYVRKNLLLFNRYGAICHHAGGYARTAWMVAKELARSHLSADGPTALVPAGGTSALGALGFVEAALELERQIENGELPEPELIVCAVGSCGTYAGLLAGLKLTRLNARVVGVRVVDRLVVNVRAVMKFGNRALALLRENGAAIGGAEVRKTDVRLLHTQFGGRYGRVTADGKAAVDLAETHGLVLETTYTGKAFAGLRDLAAAGVRGPILFWNTYNSVDLSGDLQAEDPRALPPALRAIYERTA